MAGIKRKQTPRFGAGNEGCFFIRPEDRETAVERIRRLFPGSVEESVRDADNICRHVFNILGSGNTELGPKLDWHRDFKSGESWDPRRRYDAGETYIRLTDGSDVKVPWDLSSFLHLPTLGKAFWYTGRVRYAREFAEEILDWIGNNPRPYGINWACSMKIAHRVINWVWAYHFFRDAEGIAPEFWPCFLSSLREHGRFIEKNLEDRRPANNHYLLGLAGLFYLGSAFPGMKRAKKWQRLSRELLEQEILVQVSPDGVDYEGSIYYHRFATEIFLSVLALDRKGANRFQQDFRDRLEKMLEFILIYTKPNGEAPRIGDHDDGRVQITSRYSGWEPLDHRDLLCTGAALFDRADFIRGAGRRYEETFWLLGEESLFRPGRTDGELPIPPCRSVSRSGYFIMRNQDLYLIADCLSPSPEEPAAHLHNSRLSFELAAEGVNFIVDPGTFTYTADPEQRNLFRSIAFHNTVVVDGREQNPFRNRDPWSFRAGGRTRVFSWKSEEEYDFLDAAFFYRRRSRLGRRLVHRRQIYFSKKEGFWVIRDVLSTRGRHSFCSWLHFDPEVSLVFEPGAILAERECRQLRIRLFGSGSGDFEISKGLVSESYGKKRPAPVFAWSEDFRGRAEFGMALLPGPPKAEKLAAASAVFAKLGRASDPGKAVQ